MDFLSRTVKDFVPVLRLDRQTQRGHIPGN
jgi:hypothetical protein